MVREKRGYAKVKSPEARSPEVTWHDDTPRVMWTSLVLPRVSQYGTFDDLVGPKSI
jgi:hypothetical protein